MILRNARLIFPDGIRSDVEIVVESKKIAELRPARESNKSDVIDFGGNFLAPGFIDLHIHGALGRDAMEATRDAFQTICDYHASGGTTSLLLTTATAPMAEIVRVLQAVKDLAGHIPQVAGVHVEGPFISRAKRGAQREEFITEPTAEMIHQLLRFSDVIKIVTLAPEVRGALELIEQLRDRAIRVSGGHSDADDDQTRAAFQRGLRQVTHTFNCMSSARRRGFYRTAGLLEFALSEPEILCELIADGHHVSATLMKLLYRAKGADGIALVTDATAGAGLPNESHFLIGGRECVIADGVCLLADRSALAGSASRMIDLVRTMVRTIGVPLHEAIKMATQNPARALGLEGKKGCLGAGADADFVILSPHLEVVESFCSGKRIYPRASDDRL